MTFSCCDETLTDNEILKHSSNLTNTTTTTMIAATTTTTASSTALVNYHVEIVGEHQFIYLCTIRKNVSLLQRLDLEIRRPMRIDISKQK